MRTNPADRGADRRPCSWLPRAVVASLIAGLFIGSLATRAGGEDRIKASDFTAKDLTGAKVDLSDLLKQGPVLIDFFTTCCQPCQRALPELDRLDRTYRDRGFRVIAISQDDPKTAQKVKPFVQSRGFGMIVIADPKKEIGNAYHVRQIPTAFLIDRDGSVVHFAQGYVPGDDAKWEELLKGLLAPQGSSEAGSNPDESGGR